MAAWVDARSRSLEISEGQIVQKMLRSNIYSSQPTSCGLRKRIESKLVSYLC